MQAKAEMEKLKKSIDENEKFFRKEMWQIREQTGKAPVGILIKINKL